MVNIGSFLFVHLINITVNMEAFPIGQWSLRLKYFELMWKLIIEK